MNSVSPFQPPSSFLANDYEFCGVESSPFSDLAKRSSREESDTPQDNPHYRSLRERFKISYESLQTYLSASRPPHFCSVTEGHKRAILWKAQAVALSSDLPGCVIGNRHAPLFKAMVASPEMCEKRGIKPHWTTRFSTRKKLPIMDTRNQKKTHSVLDQLLKDINKGVKEQRKSVKEIPVFPRHYPVLMEEAESNIKAILNNRYQSNRLAETVGQLPFCHELTSFYIDRSLRSGLHAVIVAIPVSISFSNMADLAEKLAPGQPHLFSEEHVAMVLMSDADYRCARSSKEMDEKSYSFFSCYETRPQPIPAVFKDYSCVIADPWLQKWGDITVKSWPAYIKECVQESLFFYKVEHNGENAPIIHSLRYKLKFNIIY